MTDREAMRLALEALDSCEFDYDNEERQVRTFDAPLVNAAHRALHQALAQPEQEPVAIIKIWDEKERKYVFTNCHTATPSKSWQSLTDEEIDYIWGVTPPDYENFFEFPRAIEAKLKEKNT